VNAHGKLMSLPYADAMPLYRALKAAGLERCYMAQAAQPVRLDGAPQRFNAPTCRQQVAARRPADPSYRRASVWHARKGGWLHPDECIITLQSVGALQEAALAQYLTAHQVQGRAEAPQAELAKF
jgi:hypothetical protein